MSGPVVQVNGTWIEPFTPAEYALAEEVCRLRKERWREFDGVVTREQLALWRRLCAENEPALIAEAPAAMPKLLAYVGLLNELLDNMERDIKEAFGPDWEPAKREILGSGNYGFTMIMREALEQIRARIPEEERGGE